MADKRKRESGKTYCAAGSRNTVNCSNKSGLPGITMHYFPSDESLRQKWIRFVRIHRKDFVPRKSSALCSAHFDESHTCQPPEFQNLETSRNPRIVKNAFYDNVRILSENHPKAFRMFPMCFTTMSECSPRIP